MREARDQGKRLSDVVEATWDRLKLAKAPINYLRALLRNPVDFAGIVSRRNGEQIAAKHHLEQRSEAERLASQNAGRTFIDVEDQRLFVIGTSGDAMTVLTLTEAIGRQAAGWMPSFAEALKTGQIRPATAMDLERFADAQRASIGTKQPNRAQPESARPPVALAVRDHIAGLRQLLQPRVMVS